MAKILILGGTREALQIASKKLADGHDVTTSLAGRTREPILPSGKCRVGGFGGAKGLADYIHHNKIDQVIDATHPFAEQISRNAREATQQTGTQLTVIQRPPWEPKDSDRWIAARDLQHACELIPAEATVLLALGAQHIHTFFKRDDVHFVVRMVTAPSAPLPFAKSSLLLGKPSLLWAEEKAMLQRENISHIVCRNSGGCGAYAKIEAARKLRLPVIMVKRPL